MADIQRDFAARVDWVSKDNYEYAEHKPALTVEEGLDFKAAPGEKITLHAKTATTDKTNAKASFSVYKDASADCAKEVIAEANCNTAEITIPVTAKQGKCIHIIVKAQADGKY